MNKNKGFTLIELLVVIAIIGILSSVVLASLNTARNKGADAATKSGLANMRAQAEIFYDSTAGGNGAGYSSGPLTTLPLGSTAACTTGTSVFTDPTFVTAIANIGISSGTAVTCGLAGTSTSKATGWSMSAATKSGTAGNWCVDSTGASKATAVSSTTGLCS